MNRGARILAVAVVVAVLCGLAWWITRARTSEGTLTPSPQTASRAPLPQEAAGPQTVRPAETRTTVAPASGPTAPRSPSASPPPARIALPPPSAVQHDSDYTVPPPQTHLRERRADAGPHAASEREALGYALDTLDDDIEQCLDPWRKSQVSLHGSLMLGIEIDPNGLQKAWIQSDAGIPLGPLSCFSNAVYGIDWSHMAHSPAMITRPYAFDEDGGT